MSVDSRVKRFSMLGLAKPYVRLFRSGTGVVDAVARAMRDFLYGGIALSPPPVAAPRIAVGTVTWSVVTGGTTWSVVAGATTWETF